MEKVATCGNGIQGLGMNLRLEYLDDVLEERPKIPFFEIIVDNWLIEGPHHEKLQTLSETYPLSFHCVGMNVGGQDPLNKKYLSKIKNLIERMGPFQISDHLCFQAHQSHNFHDLLPFPFTPSALESCVERINFIQDFLGESLLIENLSYYIEFNDSRIEEVDFINSLLDSTKAKLLLDLNNILINSHNLGSNPYSFIENLESGQVKEIHLAGGENQGDIKIDTHGAEVSEECIRLLEKFPQFLKLPIVYERDTHLLPWPEHLNYLNHLNDRLNKGQM